MPLLVDSGVLFALADRSDAWHLRCREYIESSPDPLLAPATILPEVAYLLRHRIGPAAETRFVASLADGELAIEQLRPADWKRTGELMAEYQAIGMVDATVIAIAERLKITVLATTDRRHFGLVRPAHVTRLTLVP
jgi:predicted nucleic acid-binding protein